MPDLTYRELLRRQAIRAALDSSANSLAARPKHEASLAAGTIPPAAGAMGTYDGCHRLGRGVLWLHLAGNLRTLHLHTRYLRTFLDASHGCWFVAAHLRPNLEHRNHSSTRVEGVRASGSDLDAVPYAKTVARKLGTNFAYATEFVTATDARRGDYLIKRRATQANWLTSWKVQAAAANFARSVASHHAIPLSPNDVVILSRPDVITSHAIDYAMVHQRLTAYRGMAVYLSRWSGGQVTSRDPVEMFVVVGRALLDMLCSSTGNTCLAPEWSCGHLYARTFIYGVGAVGGSAFFYGSGLQVYLHRLNSATPSGSSFLIDAANTPAKAMQMQRTSGQLALQKRRAKSYANVTWLPTFDVTAVTTNASGGPLEALVECHSLASHAPSQASSFASCRRQLACNRSAHPPEGMRRVAQVANDGHTTFFVQA